MNFYFMSTTNKKVWGGSKCIGWIAELAVLVLIVQTKAFGGQPLVNLRTSGSYAILAKSGISTVPPSAITGDIAVSPIESSAITGFSLTIDSSGQFSTSSQITGEVFAPDYASPTPVNLTTAVGDMQTAYTDAAGRSSPDYLDLGNGSIGGRTLAPGLYKWNSDVLITSDVTLSGNATNVWVFQISGNLTLANSTSLLLSGGAQPRNVFWQVAGGNGADLGTTSKFAGTILAATGVNMQTGASINGRLLTQTAVTLDANPITIAVVLQPLSFDSIVRSSNGSVTVVIATTPGLALSVQSSTNLVDWSTVASATPSASPYTWTDSSTSVQARYYRAFNP